MAKLDWSKVEVTAHQIETLNHLFKKGIVWDGDVISKQVRDELVKKGLVYRQYGYQGLTAAGRHLAENIDSYYERKYSSILAAAKKCLGAQNGSSDLHQRLCDLSKALQS